MNRAWWLSSATNHPLCPSLYGVGTTVSPSSQASEYIHWTSWSMIPDEFVALPRQTCGFDSHGVGAHLLRSGRPRAFFEFEGARARQTRHPFAVKLTLLSMCCIALGSLGRRFIKYHSPAFEKGIKGVAMTCHCECAGVE